MSNITNTTNPDDIEDIINTDILSTTADTDWIYSLFPFLTKQLETIKLDNQNRFVLIPFTNTIQQKQLQIFREIPPVLVVDNSTHYINISKLVNSFIPNDNETNSIETNLNTASTKPNNIDNQIISLLQSKYFKQLNNYIETSINNSIDISTIDKSLDNYDESNYCLVSYYKITTKHYIFKRKEFKLKCSILDLTGIYIHPNLIMQLLIYFNPNLFVELSKFSLTSLFMQQLDIQNNIKSNILSNVRYISNKAKIVSKVNSKLKDERFITKIKHNQTLNKTNNTSDDELLTFPIDDVIRCGKFMHSNKRTKQKAQSSLCLSKSSKLSKSGKLNQTSKSINSTKPNESNLNNLSKSTKNTKQKQQNIQISKYQTLFIIRYYDEADYDIDTEGGKIIIKSAYDFELKDIYKKYTIKAKRNENELMEDLANNIVRYDVNVINTFQMLVNVPDDFVNILYDTYCLDVDMWIETKGNEQFVYTTELDNLIEYIKELAMCYTEY